MCKFGALSRRCSWCTENYMTSVMRVSIAELTTKRRTASSFSCVSSSTVGRCRFHLELQAPESRLATDFAHWLVSSAALRSRSHGLSEWSSSDTTIFSSVTSSVGTLQPSSLIDRSVVIQLIQLDSGWPVARLRLCDDS